MEQDARILELLQTRIAQASGNPVTIGTLNLNYLNEGVDDKATASLNFRVTDPQLANDPDKMAKNILKALSAIDPLKEHIIYETKSCHMTRLANELSSFLQAEASLNEKDTGKRFTTIPRNAPEWFKELPKRDGWNLQHAVEPRKNENGVINISLNIPKDIDPATIVKNIEERKTAILEMLADRVVKYTPSADTPEKKEALKADVKKLHFLVKSSEDYGKTVNIEIMSDLQLQASQSPSKFDPTKTAEYVASNPLAALQNGENDKDKTKPQPHLHKALARSILFAGEKANDIFPLIAGKEDMARAVGKSLALLKQRANNPELDKKIDAFLADGVFKDPHTWGKPIEEQPDLPKNVTVRKGNDVAGKPFAKGEIEVTIPLPSIKLPEIMEKLAAIDPKAAVESSAETPPQLSALVDTIAKLSEKVDTLTANLAGKAPPILQMLVDKKALTPEQQQEALSYSKQHNILSGQAAVTLGAVTQDVVEKALKEQAALKGAPNLAASDCGCEKEKTAENIAQAIINKVQANPKDWVQKAEAGKTASTQNVSLSF